MTHYNSNSGYTEPEVPPSQDLEDDDPTVYQVLFKSKTSEFIMNDSSGIKLELEGHGEVEAPVLRE